MLETISHLRNSRLTNFVGAMLFLVVGVSVVRSQTSQIQLGVGVVFVVVGVLGVYNGIAGESVVETFRQL